MAIYNGYTVTVDFAKNTAKMNETLHLYKNDQNIPLYFQFVEKVGSMLSSCEVDILEQMNVTGVKLLILKPDGNEWRSEILHKTEGYIIDEDGNWKMQYILNGQLLDELDEIGEFDFQFRFYNDEEYTITDDATEAERITSIITIPRIKSAMHVHEPLIDDNNSVDTGSIGGTVEKDDDVYVAFDDNGIYITTEWMKRDRLNAGKLNKIEEGIKVNSENIKKLLNECYNYNNLANVPRINGITLTKNSTYKSLGISPTTHNHDYTYASLNHTHSGMVVYDDLKDYAKAKHNHDDDYATKYHNHNSDYALINHKHDFKVVRNDKLSSISNLKRPIFEIDPLKEEYKEYKLRLIGVDTTVVPGYLNLYIDINVNGVIKTILQQMPVKDGEMVFIDINDVCGYYEVKYSVMDAKANSYSNQYVTSHMKSYIGGYIQTISVQGYGLTLSEYQVFAR